MKKRPLRRVLSLCLALLMAVGLVPPVSAAGTPLDKIEVSLSDTEISPALGSTATLTAVVTPSETDGGYTSAALSYSWRSSNSEIAIVSSGNSSTATVTAMAAGEATITVTATLDLAAAGGTGTLTAQGTCKVTVPYNDPTGISLSAGTMFIEHKKSQPLSAIVQPSTADPNAVTWLSSDPTVAEVSPAFGKTVTIRAMKPGEATITATAGTGSSAYSATSVVKVPGLLLTNADDVTLYVGKEHQLGSRPYGEIGTTIEWSSSRPDIASVSTTGKITAKAPGNALIIATVKGTAYTASCSITVKENTAGMITASTSAGQPLSFSSLSSDINSQCRTMLGTSLSHVTGLSVPPTSGVLYYGYLSSDDTGYGVGSESYYYSGGGLGDRALDKVSFVPNLDFTGTAVDIRYTAYSADGVSFQGVIRVSVARATAITYSVSGNAPARFQSADFNAICRARNGRDLNYVSFSLPLSSRGTLYYNYSGSTLDPKVSDGFYYRSGTPLLDSVAFVPAQGFTGEVSIQYTGRDVQGSAFSGRVVINVTASAEGAGDIHYEVNRGKSASFDTDDFNTLCKDVTGSSLDYVRFDLPSASEGTLYYNYTSSGGYDSYVSSTRNYYRSRTPWLENVSFVPERDYTGVVKIPFTGWSVNEDRFTGVISIDVDSTSSGIITYSTAKGRAIEFDEDDFDSFCRKQSGYSLDYVRFELPSSSRGTLYYNYSGSGNYDSRVTSTRSYYLDSTPYVDRVSLVPSSSYTGTVSIPFSAVDTKGNRFSGTIEVTVGSSSSSGVASYHTDASKAVQFDDDDFNAISINQTGSSMKYVRFTLPASGQGTLYYRYSSSSKTTVASSMSYYRSSSPYLEDISFLPASGFTGTSRFAFSGYATNGESFSGTVEVSVGGSSSKKVVSYSTKSGTPVTFNDSDFNTLCRDETGSTLNYIRIDQLPTTSQGTLYYNYTSASKYDSKAATSRSYYRSSSPYLSSLCFVPVEGYSGTISIPYTAYSTSSDKFSGTIQITVDAPTPTSAIYYSTDTAPVPFQIRDFQSACSARSGSPTLKHVLFTLPSDEVGTLYYGYDAPFQYSSAVSPLLTYTVDSSRPISSIVFVPKAFYSGTASITYTGYDTAGKSYSGTVQITVRPNTASSQFTDVGKYGWAASSIDYLYRNKVVSGVGGSNYGPGQQIIRGDYLLMLSHALRLPESSDSPSFVDVPAQRYYAQAIASAERLGVLHDSGSYFYPERALTRQDAAVYMYNGLRAAGYPVPSGNTAYLSSFTDRASIPSYAQTSMASLVEMGLLGGDENHRLNPGASLTRAEMAVILHRAMTL